MLRERLDSPWVTGLFGLVVALLTWEYVQITPAPGLDASWILGLNLGAADGLDHGTELIFTYGPLGFLEQPMTIDGLLATTGAIYLLAIRAAFAASLLWAARRSFPWPAAAALALVVAAIAPAAIIPIALTAIWCLVALGDDSPPWAPRLVAIGGGAMAALELLVKINVGVTITAMVAVAVLGLPGARLRNVLTALASFAIAIAVLWPLSGQGLSNLGDYASSSFEIVTGYSENAQVDATELAWDWLAALLLGLATLAATVRAGAQLSVARRIAIAGVVVVLVLALEKYAFVRHDTGHVGAFFGCLAGAWLALVWRGGARWAAVTAVGASAVLFFAATGQRVGDSIDLDRGADQLRTLLVPGERDDATDAAREQLRAAYAVDPALIARIGDEPVDARPWEIALPWAYDLAWDPLPVIQDYAAYTPKLDEINADALADPGGPRWVLRHFGFGSPAVGADGRYINYDVPAEARVLFCRFRPVASAGRYELLERSEDRCGPERSLGTVEAAYGESVPVPEAGPREAVLVRIDGVDPAGVERLRTLLYRAAIRRLGLDAATVRFASANAGHGLLLSVPRGSDLPKPWNLAPNASSVAIFSDGGFATSEPDLRYEFAALPVDPWSSTR